MPPRNSKQATSTSWTLFPFTRNRSDNYSASQITEQQPVKEIICNKPDYIGANSPSQYPGSSTQRVLPRGPWFHRHRASSDSGQGTTIVYETPRSSSYNQANWNLQRCESIPVQFSIPGSAAHVSLYGPQQGHRLNSEEVNSIDELRRQGETEFYEHVEEGQITRRRSMIRSVSKEDYLLARGANPRTGLITPGCPGIASSHEDPNDSQIRKWRQKGNEWITLDVNQQTPLPTPLCQSESLQERSTPNPHKMNELSAHQSLVRPNVPWPVYSHVAQKPSRHATATVLSNSKSFGSSGNSHAQVRVPSPQKESFIPPAIPLASHIAKQQSPVKSSMPDIKVDSPIRRKPVAAQHAYVTDEQESPPPTEDLPAVVKVDGPQTGEKAYNDQILDSSQGQSQLSSDGGKGLPRLPTAHAKNKSNQSNKNKSNDSLYDQTRYASKQLDHVLTNLNAFRQNQIEKDLPRPPVSNGQTLPTVQLPQQTQDSGAKMAKLIAGIGPWGGNPAYPYTRTPQSWQETNPELRQNPLGGNRTMPPQKHSPTKSRFIPPERPANAMIEGPRRMPPRHSNKSFPANSVSVDPRLTTSTSTIMFTDTTMPHQVPRHRSRPPEMTRPHTSSHPSGDRMFPVPRPPRQLSGDMSMNRSMNSNDLLSIAMPRIRPRANSRPAMPNRADGMTSIPKLEQPRQRSRTVGIVQQPIPRQMAMSYNEYVGADMIPRPLRPRLPEEYQRRPTIDEPVLAFTSKPGTLQIPLDNQSALTRKCSRCHDEIVDGHSRKADSVVSALETAAATIAQSALQKEIADCKATLLTQADDKVEDTRKHSKVQTPSEDVPEVDLRDHSICCPDCCKEDCHEGCLGHPGSTPSSILSTNLSDVVSESSNLQTTTELSNSRSSSPDKTRQKARAVIRLSYRKSEYVQEDAKRPEQKDSDTQRPSFAMPIIELAAMPQSTPFKANATSTMVSSGAVQAAKSAISEQKNGSSVREGDYRTNKKSPHAKPKDTQHTLARDIAKLSPHKESRNDAQPRPTTANEARRVASISSLGTELLTTTATASSVSSISGSQRNRSASGASAATVEIQVPGLGTMGFGTIFEVAVVPFEVSRMWLRNHPAVMGLGWEAMERGWEMATVVAATAGKIWRVIFVYSKTGKIKIKSKSKDHAGMGFMVDCARSALYLLVFLGVGAFVLRVIRLALGVLSLIGMVFRLFFWVVRR